MSQYTVYKDPAGKTIATKNATFPGPYLPSFRLNDKRDGWQEGTAVRGGSVQMYLKKGTAESMEKKNLPKPSPAVADDGVDMFLRDNLNKLKAGQALSFHLAVPNRFDWFKFTARKSGEVTRKGRKALVVSMTLNNAILRRLLPTIKFVYDIEKNTLYEFQGVSVINGPNKKSYHVRTVFGPERKS